MGNLSCTCCRCICFFVLQNSPQICITGTHDHNIKIYEKCRYMFLFEQKWFFTPWNIHCHLKSTPDELSCINNLIWTFNNMFKENNCLCGMCLCRLPNSNQIEPYKGIKSFIPYIKLVCQRSHELFIWKWKEKVKPWITCPFLSLWNVFSAELFTLQTNQCYYQN